MNHIFICLHHVDGQVHVGRKKAGGGIVMLWAVFCWETWGAGFHVDVTLTRTTLFQEPLFIEMAFPKGSGLIQKDNECTPDLCISNFQPLQNNQNIWYLSSYRK